MAIYAIDDEHGTELCAGLCEHQVERVARELADRLGAPVYVYRGTEHPTEVRPGGALS